MTQGVESFRKDIKRYEDILSSDPNSYCFAPLAELYRKAGLLDNAIATARKGIEIYPDYVGGHLALGRACLEKGEQAESRTALERVVRATPDNPVAQKLLSQIYIDSGEIVLARKALETILLLSPDDVECKEALDRLEQHGRSFEPETNLLDVSGGAPHGIEEDEFLLEEAEIIEELSDEVIDEGVGAEEPAQEEFEAFNLDSTEPLIGEDSEGTPESAPDPLQTATIAQLYIDQGFLKKALKIYRDLQDSNPDNVELRERIVDLKRRIDEDEARARESVIASEMPFADEFVGAATEQAAIREDAPVVSGGEGAVVATLERWLDTIGRMRECRSGRR